MNLANKNGVGDQRITNFPESRSKVKRKLSKRLDQGYMRSMMADGDQGRALRCITEH
jgi:hypothetical protein